MVSIIRRMRKLRGLLAIRLGPGAAILPPEVRKIHMDFSLGVHDGHYGPKKFWRNCLPRLKYHNPAIPMTIHRSNNQEGPALMTIHFASSSDAANIPSEISSTADKQASTGPVTDSQAGPPTERTQVINMKHRSESEIVEQLLKLTKAKIVRATPEELREIQELEEQDARSFKDQAEMNAVVAKRKREQLILEQARGEVDAVQG